MSLPGSVRTDHPAAGVGKAVRVATSDIPGERSSRREIVGLFSTRSDLEGVPSSRAHHPYKAFETTIDRVLGDRVRADGARGVDLWCARANVEWHSPDGHMISYSFRRAGELVAWVPEDGDGMDWYCSGEPAVVADWISDALAEAGWSWTTALERQG